MNLLNDKLSPSMLKDMKVSNDTIAFIKMHNLGEYSLSDLDIYGDYLGYMRDLNINLGSSRTYDNGGNITSKTDVDGLVEFYTHDENGNMTVLDFEKYDSIHWEYDENGNVISHKRPGVFSIEYTYDANDNMISMSKTTCSMPEGRIYTEVFTYDENNNMVSRRSPGIFNEVYTYDIHNNILTSKSINEYTVINGIEYDSSGNTLPIWARSIKRKYSNEWVYTYDKSGNMLTSNDSERYNIEYAYDSSNKMVSYEAPTYRYSTINLPKNVLCQVYKNGILILEIKLK